MLIQKAFYALVLLTRTAFLYGLIQPQFVEIQAINDTILVDLFLADAQNFLGQALYPNSAKAYIDKNVAIMLDNIQKELFEYGLCLKIKDAYRPFSVQKKLWEIALTLNLPDPGDYVSDPVVEGGRHPRGVAVDVTLVHLEDHSELPMPPMGFTPKAHHGYIGDLTNEQIKNRAFLKSIMEKHGFVGISCEWWHYNLSDWQEYEAVDVSFDELKQKFTMTNKSN